MTAHRHREQTLTTKEKVCDGHGVRVEELGELGVARAPAAVVRGLAVDVGGLGTVGLFFLGRSILFSLPRLLGLSSGDLGITWRGTRARRLLGCGPV